MTNVLVVDDEEGFQTLLGDVLGQAGHTVVTARTGQEGLARLAERPFDLLLVDQRLPDLSGLEFLDHYRSAGHRAPVIVMTAFAEVPLVVSAMRLGAADFLIKPFGLDTLLPVVARCLRPPAAAS